MPIYATRCTHCGREDSVYRAVDNRDKDLPLCPDDDFPTVRIVSAPYIAPDIQPYQSMIDGSWITSRSRHAAHLKEHKCIEIGNETHHLKPKTGIDVSPESKARRKEEIVRQVSALK